MLPKLGCSPSSSEAPTESHIVESTHGFRCQFQHNSSYVHNSLFSMKVLKMSFFRVPSRQKSICTSIFKAHILTYTKLTSYTFFTVQYIPLPIGTLGSRWYLGQYLCQLTDCSFPDLQCIPLNEDNVS